MQALRNKFSKTCPKGLCVPEQFRHFQKQVNHGTGEGGIRLTGNWTLTEGFQRCAAVTLCGNHKHWRLHLEQSEAACLCTWTTVWGSLSTLSPGRPHLAPRHRSTNHQGQSSAGCLDRMGRTVILNSCKSKAIFFFIWSYHGISSNCIVYGTISERNSETPSKLR